MLIIRYFEACFFPGDSLSGKLNDLIFQSFFRVLLPNVADRVEPVRLNLPATQDISICEAVDYCIRLVSRKVVEVHRKYPDLKIVLVGWGTSCVINHQVSYTFAKVHFLYLSSERFSVDLNCIVFQVVQCMPNVSAIINFAFPMKTADGPRGVSSNCIELFFAVF